MTINKWAAASIAIGPARSARRAFLGSFAQAMDTLLARLRVFGAVGLALSWFLCGMSETAPAGLLAGGPLASICGALTAVVAAALNLVFYGVVGLSALFVKDTSPM